MNGSPSASQHNDFEAGIEPAIAAFRQGRDMRAERLARDRLAAAPDDVQAQALLTLLFPGAPAGAAGPMRPSDTEPVDPQRALDPVRIAEALRRTSHGRARFYLRQQLQATGDNGALQLGSLADRLFAEADQLDLIGVHGTRDAYQQGLVRHGLGRTGEIVAAPGDALPELFLAALAQFEEGSGERLQEIAGWMTRRAPEAAWTQLALVLPAALQGDVPEVRLRLSQAASQIEHAVATGQTPEPSPLPWLDLLTGWLGSGDSHLRADRMRRGLQALPQLIRWRQRQRGLFPPSIPDWQWAWTLSPEPNRFMANALADLVRPDSIVLDILPGLGVNAWMAARAGAACVYILVGTAAHEAMLRALFEQGDPDLLDDRIRFLHLTEAPSIDRNLLQGRAVDLLLADMALPHLLYSGILSGAAIWKEQLGHAGTRCIPETLHLRIRPVRGTRHSGSVLPTRFGPLLLGGMVRNGAATRIATEPSRAVGADQLVEFRLGETPRSALLRFAPLGGATHLLVEQHLLYRGNGAACSLQTHDLAVPFAPVVDHADGDPIDPDPRTTAYALVTPDDISAHAAAYDQPADPAAADPMVPA